MDKLRLIAGSGRSGTTWVLDALADANRMRPVFEPLHPLTSRIAKEFGYAYLTRQTKSDELKQFFEAIEAGEVGSIWYSYRVLPVRLRPTYELLFSTAAMQAYLKTWRLFGSRALAYRYRERRGSVLVKCIRANLMLDWIHGNIDANIVLLIRHPCAVVESQLRFPETWDPYWLLKKYCEIDGLMNGPLFDQINLDHARLTRCQALTAIWCIENVLPLSQAADNNYQVVFYEELLEQPQTQWRRVADGLRVATVPTSEELSRPSQQSAIELQGGTVSNKSYSENYDSWRNRLSNVEISAIASMLRDFRVDFYSISEIRPNMNLFTRRYSLDSVV